MFKNHSVKYWEKKYRLWRILHGVYCLPECSCNRCKWSNKNCLNKKTLTFDYEKNVVFFNIGLTFGPFVCIEWIKYV